MMKLALNPYYDVARVMVSARLMVSSVNPGTRVNNTYYDPGLITFIMMLAFIMAFAHVMMLL